MTTCTQLLAWAQGLGLDRLDAQLLLLHALGRPGTERAWLLAHDSEVLPDAPAALYRQLGQRRASGEPLAYIVGSKEFFGLHLEIDARVLIPRPDTETLVAWALQILQQAGLPPAPQVLDLGTGSGAIALALKNACPAWQVSALDASAGAVAVAAANAKRLGLPLDLQLSHWFEKVTSRFHLIVSNPPYVADADPHLAALSHEPAAALTAGPDGLSDIRQIIERSPAHLEPGGWLLLEHGYDQSARVQQLLLLAGFAQVQGRQDLGGVWRCAGGQWPAESNASRKTAG